MIKLEEKEIKKISWIVLFLYNFAGKDLYLKRK